MPEHYPNFHPEQPHEQPHENPELRSTDESVRRKAELAMKIYCKETTVEGKEKLVDFQSEHPNEKYILASSHFTGLDVQAAIAELGDRFDIQVTGESTVKDIPTMRFLISQIGSDRFSELQYKQEKGGTKSGIFRPENFDELTKIMERGRTPWFAVHSYSRQKKMTDARVGSAYLAQKTKSWIIPTALLLEGGPMNLDKPLEQVHQILMRLRGKAKARYAIGSPLQLPEIQNFQIIETVIQKRARGERVTPEEKAEFHRVHMELNAQADQIATAIAALLPEQHRGSYSGESHK